MKITLISGMSGSGKSTAIKTLEDLGYYCIDNLPLNILPELIEWYKKEYGDGLLAVGVDTRSKGSFEGMDGYLDMLEKRGAKADILFLDARDDVLIRRFSETRRSHPLTIGDDVTLREALEKERDLLYPLKSKAYLLDTSHLKIEELKNEVRRFASLEKESLNITLVSFGFKYGLPIDLDFVFDVRNLPNPYWRPELRLFTGDNPKVVEFFKETPDTDECVRDLHFFIERRVKDFRKGTRSYLSFGIGCTGGRHRSVYAVNEIARMMRDNGLNIIVRHRDMDKSGN